MQRDSNSCEQSNAASTACPAQVAVNIENAASEKRKRSAGEISGEGGDKKRPKLSIHTPERTASIELITQNRAEMSNAQWIGKKRMPPVDRGGEHNDRIKRRRVNTETVNLISPEHATLVTATALTGVQAMFQRHLMENAFGHTQFEVARRYLTEKGTSGINEGGLAHDAVRALRLVKRLEQQAKETPEEARKRMRSKSRRLIRDETNEPHRSPQLIHAKGKKKAWIMPNRLDEFVDESKDNAEDDKWSTGDEEATKDMERQADDCAGPKRRRRIPWLEQNGWNTEEMMGLLETTQAAMLEEAKQGLEKQQWEKYKEENPDWEEEEAKKKAELKKQRKEKRKAAKKEEEEKRKRHGGVMDEAPKKGAKRQTGRRMSNKLADTGDSLNRVGGGQDGTANDEPEKERRSEKEVERDAPEPEGEFDINDWASDEDEEEGEMRE